MNVLPRAARTKVVFALIGAALLATTSSPVIGAAAATGSSSGTVVRGYLTTADLRSTFDRLPDRSFSRAAAPTDADRIVIDDVRRGQSITAGFGVAMTDTSAWLLSRELDPSQRSAVLRKLFSRDYGIGLSFLRVPIGGSDYIVAGTPYTYDDRLRGDVDPGLEHFSVAHDRAYVFPMIRQALAINPGIRVMANPWTPPAWMKLDRQLVSTTPLGTLRPEFYGAFARYLVKSLQAFRANGVPVRYLGVQNEPYTPIIGAIANIPSSFLTGADEARLIADHLAPELQKAGLAPHILGYDDGFQRAETFIPLLMAGAGRHVDGFAYHCYFSDPITMKIIGMLYPGKEQLQTECSSILSSIEPAQMMIRNLRNGASGVQLWNAVLDQNGGPKIGTGCVGLPGGPGAGKPCIAPVTVDRKAGTYRLTSDYWALAHFSKFIRRGAVRLSSTSATCLTSPLPPQPCGVETVAFDNLDGTRVLVVTAHDGRAHTISVEDDAGRFSARVPDGATATFVWKAS